MSRIAKWKLEKTKVKVVFRLQFHATNTPQTGWDKLFVSFIPADSLKATAKTSKASVRNGTCKWADPIYETTRLIQDTKSKQYEDKYYKLVVAMGSSRSGFLGEGIINLADYADASQPSAIALPLQGCNFSTILHVAVQPLNSKTGFREFEQQRELRETGLQTTVQGVYNESTANLAPTGEMARDQGNGRVRFKSESKDLPSLEEVAELNEDYADSTTGIDVSSTTSGSLYADKHDSSTHEIDSLKSTTSGDLAGLSLNHSPNPDKGDHRNAGQGANDWVHAWSSDYSLDNDLAAAYEENSRLKGSLDMAESSILELKLEVSSLQNQAKELGSKTQKFDEVLDAEVVSGKELAKEVSILKSECSKFKDDYEQLKHSRSSPHLTSGDIIVEDQSLLLQTLQMGWMQGLLVMEEKVRFLQNKGRHEYHGRDFPFPLPELESLEKVLQDLKQVTTQVPSSLDVEPALADAKHIRARFEESNKFISGNKLLDIGTDLYSGRSPQLSQEPDHYVATIALEAKISELQKELEESKFEQDSLTKKLDQMECYYEALIQELEESQKQMLGELQSLRTEHSTCFYTISSCKTQMEAMHQDMNTQFVRFVEDKRDLVSLNKELEERAITSETALRKARWHHSVAVGQLQKDLELLSFQVLSMFETNENLIKEAFKESSIDCYQDYVEDNSEAVDSCLQKKIGVRNLDSLDMLMDSAKSDAVKPLQCLDHNEEKQLLSGDIHFVDLKRSIRLQEELYQKAEDELGEMHMVNLNLYIFSKVLQETLHESTNGIKLMKQKLDELAKQLDYSTVSNELLMIKLQATIDDVNTQKEMHANYVTKYNELALQNQMIEERLQGVYDENSDLIHKISDYESLIMEYRSYESKYDVCTSEKSELLNLLKQENLDKYSLQNEVTFLHDELRNLKTDYDIQSSFKGGLEKTVSSLQDELVSQNQVLEEKLQNLSDENGLLAQRVSEYESSILEYKGYKRKYELSTAEKTELENLSRQETLEKSRLQQEVSSLHEELRNLKEDFDTQSSLNGNLEQTISSLQDKSALQNRMLEEKLKGTSDENCVLAQKVLEYETVIMEYRSYENKYKVCSAEKAEMLDLLQQETLDKCSFQNEVGSLKEDLRLLKADLDFQSSLKGKLEETVTFLQDKLCLLMSTMVIYDEQINGASCITSNSVPRELDNESFGSTFLHLEQLQKKAYNKIAQLIQEKKDVEEQRDSAQGSLGNTDSVIISMKLKYESDIQDMANKLDSSMCHLVSLQLEIEEITNKLKLSSEYEERYAENTKEMSSKLAAFETELQNVTSENHDLVQKILALENVNAELERTKLAIADSERQSEAMAISLNASNEVSVKLKDELKSTKESLGCIRDELLSETTSRVELEKTVAELSSQLGMKNDQLISLDAHKSEILHLKQLVADIEHEKSRICDLLLLSEESGRKADADALSLQAQVSDLECHLAALHGIVLAADVELVYTRSQFLSRMQELVQQLESLDSCYRELHIKHLAVLNTVNDRISSYRELHIKHLAVLNTVNDRISSKAQYVEENAVLMSTLGSLRSELAATVVERKSFLDRIKVISEELEKHKNRADVAESNFIECTNRHELEIAHVKHALLSFQEEADVLLSSKEELETTVIVIKSKLDEQRLQILSLEDELTQLRNQQKELTRRLSEQSLKTEEFKNLSIHLKELKDRAEAECVQAREKREAEGQSVVAQESLRMVFMRDQCETKVQEMRNQILISKKHGEEMLFKLQDALSEIEKLKKSEASEIKRNEEQSLKVLDLESELQRVLAEKREKVNTYDRMQAELECSLISLECCKEEKQKLETSLEESNEERYKITVELNSVRERLESLPSSTILQQEKGISKPVVGEDSCREGKDASQVPVQDGIVSRSLVGISRQAGQKGLLQNDAHHLALIDEHAKAQSIMSSMDNLHHELERMKNENLGSILPHEQQHCQPIFQGLEREQLQLHKTNEELRSIFPLFSEFSSCGNALERVLALEMELAESLQAKKKSGFQSSFLKQHSDEEAIFQSFKDINDLIKDMLEMKGRYATVETELKEMHDRYSQLSLQLAEVEGERQKLVMTLKNARSPKRLTYL